MKPVPGYCGLCRRKEIELYGTVLHSTDQKHIDACEKAACRHPAVYMKVWISGYDPQDGSRGKFVYV